MRTIIIVVAFLVSLVISCMAMPFLMSQTFAIVDGFTHAVFNENFGWPS